MSRSLYWQREAGTNRATPYGSRRRSSRQLRNRSHRHYAASHLSTAWHDHLAAACRRQCAVRVYAELIAPSKLNDGASLRYGYGTPSPRIVILRFSGHGGFVSPPNTGVSRTRSWRLRLTTSDLRITVARSIAAAFCAALARHPFQCDARRYSACNKVCARRRQVSRDADAAGVAFSINGQPTETLPWVEGWTFRKRDVLLSFRAGPTSDRAAELRFDTGGDHFILKPVSATAPTMAAPLSAFEGTYEGAQPGRTLTIAIENDTLRVLPSGGGKGNLIPQSGTTFFNDVACFITFSRVRSSPQRLRISTSTCVVE